MSDHPLDLAITAIEQALDSRPKVDGRAFTAATQAVCAYRDSLRLARRCGLAQAEDLKQLEDANLAVALLVSGHFGLGQTPWRAIAELPKLLARMRGEVAGASAS
jgi:hypothetical protein